MAEAIANGLEEGSPSSRRAWIEIVGIGTVKQSLPVALLAEGVDRNNGYIIRCKIFFVVALLAEGVDRNLLCHRYLLAPEMSPSSRRAWIEIPCVRLVGIDAGVALLAEGVDRNS